MKADSIYFKGHSCFKKDWAGFDEIKPINVIIGRNNSGKSHLLDLVEALCDGELFSRGWEYWCRGVLDEASLKRVFSENSSEGDLRGNHWSDHGQYLVNAEVTCKIIANEVSDVKFLDNFDLTYPHSQYYQQDPSSIKQLSDARISRVKEDLMFITHQLNETAFRRLFADRDIKTELPSTELGLGSDGAGATNIIRRFITSEKLPREVIQDELLDSLNSIFGSDGQFSEIQVQVHDEAQEDAIKDYWEVYLGEETKGLIPLSQSGSGLKTVFLVLLNLLVIPALLHESYRGYGFGMLLFCQLLFSTRYDWGLPRWIIRLRIAQPSLLSTCWLASLRALS